MLITTLLISILSIVIVSILLNNLIFVSHKKKLYDTPSEFRKIHLVKTPNLGGVAIFLATILAISARPAHLPLKSESCIFACCTIIFLLGLKDDLIGLNPRPKIIVQTIVSLIVTVIGDFRIADFHGIFSVHEIPYLPSLAFSVGFIVLVTNAINLIDGINCLAAGIGLVTNFAFAIFFWSVKEYQFFYLCITISAALAGFLYFNKTPAKIFMGDSGSLTLGFSIAIFAIHFLSLTRHNQSTFINSKSAPAIAFALLIIPIFDTLRLFVIRWINGQSPMTADRNHIHHRLLDLGFSHLQATGLLITINTVIFGTAILLQNLPIEVLLVAVLAMALVFNWLVSLRLKVSQNKKTRKMNLSYKSSELAAV
jgi:UDP-GlcNAc:undecaprenyl-phosphate/decaprenyl-phosphate GlcNAc-1-phosphate transferase